MFYEESEILFQETQKMLKEAKKVSREENKKIDDEWLKKVNTTMNLISSNSNDFRSVSEVVSSAKKAAAALPKRLKEETKWQTSTTLTSKTTAFLRPRSPAAS